MIILRKVTIIFIFCAFLVLQQISAKERIWIEDLDNSPAATSKALEEFALFSAKILMGMPGSIQELSPEIKQDRKPRVVFISVTDYKKSAYVVSGGGDGYIQAFEKALEKFHSLVPSGFNAQGVKTDIVTSISGPFTITKQLPPSFVFSLQGFAIAGIFTISFLPEEVITENIVSRGNILLNENMYTHFRKKGINESLITLLQQQNNFNIYTFSTRSFFSDGNTVDELFRGHSLFPVINKELLSDSLDHAAYFLMQAMNDDGSFSNSSNQNSAGESLSVRARTLYALLNIYSISRDNYLLEQIKKSFFHLLKYTKQISLPEYQALCVVKNNIINLHTNALVCSVLAKYIELSGDRQYIPTLLQLGRWILYTQDQSGLFSGQEVVFSTKEVLSSQSGDCSLDAILALLHIHSLLPSDIWFDAAEQGLQFILNELKDSKNKSLLNNPSFLNVLGALYKNSGKDVYKDKARIIAESIIAQQNMHPEHYDWLGSYTKPPESIITATHTVSLCAVYELLKNSVDSPFKKKLFDAIILGLRFQLQTQFTPSSALYLYNPESSIGGFHQSLTDFTIDLDSMYYNISSITSFLNILRQREIIKQEKEMGHENITRDPNE